MSAIPAPRALLWDIDGTVAETERDGHRVAFNLAFAEAGLSVGWTEVRYGELLHVTGGRERLLADMPHWPDAPAHAAEREALASRLHGAKNRHYAALILAHRVQPRDGVLGVMQQAAAEGVDQGIVTTTSRANVEALMGSLLGPDWATRFAVVVCGEDTVRKKPDPEAYTLALRRLGLHPDQALALEDSTPGVRAARACGLRVALRPSLYFPCDTAPDDPAVWWQPASQAWQWPSLKACWFSRGIGRPVEPLAGVTH